MQGAISGSSILHSRVSCRVMVSIAVGTHAVESAHEFSERMLLAADPWLSEVLRTIRREGVAVSSSTNLNGEWSPEKVNDLYYLLNKKRVKREKERREEIREGREKRGEDCERGQGVAQIVTRYHS